MASNLSFQTQTPKIIQWVIQYSGGYIKNEKQAQYVLIGLVVVMITVAAMLLVFNGGGGEAKFEAPPGKKVLYPENAPPRLVE